MTQSAKVIARRRETAGGLRGSSWGSARLPDELLTEQVQRLAVFSTVVVACWTFGLFMDVLVLPAGLGVVNWRAIPIEVAATLAAVSMWVYLRTSSSAPSAKTTVGLGFMVLNAVAIAAFNAWAMPPLEAGEVNVSWNAILILVYSMIAPSTPRRMLVASLAAAAMDPAAFVLAPALGAPPSAAMSVLVMCWPNFACAVIAMLPSRVLQRIGGRLREAQEMGRYHLVELLGTGGMGEVWRAEHQLLARNAAVKLIRPEVLGVRDDIDGKLAIRRFEREAQATAQLSSPHSIHVFDFGVTQDGTFYYVMELLSGRDLESLVREFGPVPASRAVFLLRQACHSLADAHARGLVHRDIKPANIYVCRMGLEYDFVKVLDFGLVKVGPRHGGADTLATLDHTTTGTPAYMAPELILGEGDVDRRADVYALGCVAYYLLTGQLVFEADTPMKMFLQHLHALPVAPSQRSELPIPRQLDALVMACLEKDPNNRPQDAQELFKMTCGCQSSEEWTRDDAAGWWRIHLPDLCGPLTVAAPNPRVASTAGAL